jgi:hypothetical protein
MNRKYLPTMAELIDRLSIVQLKEVKIPEHKEEYAKEIADIVHDLDDILDNKEIESAGEFIRAIIVLAQMNAHIWENESKVRNNSGDGNLALTHGINGIRNTAKNKLSDVIGGRKDYKIDCLAAEFKDWEVSWPKEERELEKAEPIKTCCVESYWEGLGRCKCGKKITLKNTKK